MYQHHREAIEKITEKLRNRKEVQGVIVGGSVAHGFATESSDIDLMIVLSDEDYERAVQCGEIGYYETEATPWPDGYVDGKYTSAAYIRKVGESGSEPAKFAFLDSFVTHSVTDGLQELVAAASRYPIERKDDNILRFHAQCEAWKWYYSEGLKRNNRYLMDCSLSNYVLFAGRMILAENEMLYPYHKWFLRVLEGAEKKPAGLMSAIHRVLDERTMASLDSLHDCVMGFRKWAPENGNWSKRFMLDSELNWLQGNVPIADL